MGSQTLCAMFLQFTVIVAFVFGASGIGGLLVAFALIGVVGGLALVAVVYTIFPNVVGISVTGCWKDFLLACIVDKVVVNEAF